MNESESRRMLTRWWIGTASSSMVLAFGAYLLLMRYALGRNPLGDGYWPVTGLVLGFGALRLGMQLLRRRYLFDGEEENPQEGKH